MCYTQSVHCQEIPRALASASKRACELFLSGSLFQMARTIPCSRGVLISACASNAPSMFKPPQLLRSANMCSSATLSSMCQARGCAKQGGIRAPHLGMHPTHLIQLATRAPLRELTLELLQASSNSGWELPSVFERPTAIVPRADAPGTCKGPPASWLQADHACLPPLCLPSSHGAQHQQPGAANIRCIHMKPPRPPRRAHKLSAVFNTWRSKKHGAQGVRSCSPGCTASC